MTIISVYFNFGTDKRYTTLADVFKYSVEKNCPGVELKMIKIENAHKKPGIKTGMISNTLKIAEWDRLVNEIDDDIILMDCDMVVLSDLKHVFSQYKFDIAITKRIKKIQMVEFKEACSLF